MGAVVVQPTPSRGMGGEEGGACGADGAVWGRVEGAGGGRDGRGGVQPWPARDARVGAPCLPPPVRGWAGGGRDGWVGEKSAAAGLLRRRSSIACPCAHYPIFEGVGSHVGVPFQMRGGMMASRAGSKGGSPRVCATPGCGASIDHRHGSARYCEACAYARRLRAGRNYRRGVVAARKDAPPPGCRRWEYRRPYVVLLVRQRGRCGICGRLLRGDDPTEWAVDLIRPAAAGGEDEAGNHQVVHEGCGQLKGDQWEGTDGAQRARWAGWTLAER